MMGQFHREHPELIGTSADPWSQHESYRKAIAEVERDCEGCGRYTRLSLDGLCVECEKDGW